MKEAKFIKKENEIADYDIDESNKEVANTKEYKAEKPERSETNEKNRKKQSICIYRKGCSILKRKSNVDRLNDTRFYK